ncbi:hypothetical protein BWQ96_03790 [Gracilariopsis chorda]|uniref:Uncharacterized protein n=1 Tax=Gracilariopsis chorda TaxID=448386 RepID=A0A2V3IWJ3_9FLOR|nr:hypothetical protein BWQ96_03790 [Gracilariopsis chorda]|eukprot:PXF46465.1 hypothetical protein BWQ96_03790 [Gracilariopsis chorda]
MAADPSCKTDLDCASAESCRDFSGIKQCVSDQISINREELPSSKPEEPLEKNSSACIAVEVLNNFERDDFVYESHRLARVLCDASGSCATGGHIFEYEGNVMMMKSYCEMQWCTEAIRKVNSPRYRVGLRVESRSMALSFTAHAARYGSRIEEIVLTSLVRFGL